MEWVREVSASVGWVTGEGVLRRRVEWAMGGECSWLGYWVRPDGVYSNERSSHNQRSAIHTETGAVWWGVSVLQLRVQLYCIWTVSGRTVSVLYLDCIWTVSGLYLDCIWAVSGLYLAHLQRCEDLVVAVGGEQRLAELGDVPEHLRGEG